MALFGAPVALEDHAFRACLAALYGARKQGISGMLALQEVSAVLPNAGPNSDFRRALQRLAT
jgi:hypothetical protein